MCTYGSHRVSSCICETRPPHHGTLCFRVKHGMRLVNVSLISVSSFPLPHKIIYKERQMLPGLNVAKLWLKDREIRKDDSRKIRFYHIFISTNSKKKKIKTIKMLKASLVSHLIHFLELKSIMVLQSDAFLSRHLYYLYSTFFHVYSSFQ